jgi:GH15 family glucan-1,4-alpha-glucosidase
VHQSVDVEERSRAQFESVPARSKGLPLITEQFKASLNEPAGNFPQTLAHLAVIST